MLFCSTLKNWRKCFLCIRKIDHVLNNHLQIKILIFKKNLSLKIKEDTTWGFLPFQNLFLLGKHFFPTLFLLLETNLISFWRSKEKKIVDILHILYFPRNTFFHSKEYLDLKFYYIIVFKSKLPCCMFDIFYYHKVGK